MYKRVLYAVQGTGNGHVARARQIIPLLQQMAEVDVWLGGTESEVDLPQEPRYKVKGFVMYYNKSGGVSYWKTALKNNYLQIIRDVFSAPVKAYDLVLNDFEFVTAWACKFRGICCIALSHQASYYYNESPRPRFKNLFGEFVLRWYAPAHKFVGFHFQSYHHNIFLPVIRDEVRQLKNETGKHITVYLPAYAHANLIDYFVQFPNHFFHIFSKFARSEFRDRNVWVRPINNETFLKSFATCGGVVCGAGFETPAEALYLGKRLLVVPIKGQYEQKCNAAALMMEGVLVLNRLNDRSAPMFKEWLESALPQPINYPDNTSILLQNVVASTPNDEA